MTDFNEAHLAFVSYHLDRRTGERRGRLDRGHGHAEILFAKNVWWPLKGHFDHLHPEYEVLDWRGKPYYADFVFAPHQWKIVIEIKGFTEHVTNMDRNKYCNELNRETFLSGMGFHIISFAYDDVAHRPELCIYLLRMMLSQYESSESKVERVNFADKEILRYAVFLARPLRPIDVSNHFSINHRTAIAHLKRLCHIGWVKPVPRGSGQRILYYQVTKNGLDNGLV
ncbi:MAG: hypothetical protein P0Y55_11265 [Candidatus Cohnella colombiensis]|uniref:DUF559 domain-containing protein n=1 Tax=Candidatus Cohnella colombiensis TaxID=3121368 RepID=A0AA95EWE5_9BACL|nr:MAG: hypothetical protein P0Y55_11265 [Cohnella sp.]